MKNKLGNTVGENEELLIRAIMDFYAKHRGYRMSNTKVSTKRSGDGYPPIP